MDSLHFTDRMNEFWRFLEDTRGSPSAERLQAFKAGIVEPNIRYYSSVFGISDAGLTRYLQDVEARFVGPDAGQGRVLERFDGCLQMFRQRFPSFQADLEICLLPSLNLFKGTAIPHPGRIVLLLGVDALAGLDDAQFKGYLTHELFHAYHFQRVPAVREAAERTFQTMQMPPLWGLLWTEGLACQAVRLVYPETLEQDVLDWRPLVEETRPRLSALADEALRLLESDSLQDIAGFFYFPRPDRPDIPVGCGYYLGMLAAERLIREQPLEHLLDLDDAGLLVKIRAALAELQG